MVEQEIIYIQFSRQNTPGVLTLDTHTVEVTQCLKFKLLKDNECDFLSYVLNISVQEHVETSPSWLNTVIESFLLQRSWNATFKVLLPFCFHSRSYSTLQRIGSAVCIPVPLLELETSIFLAAFQYHFWNCFFLEGVQFYIVLLWHMSHTNIRRFV